MSKNAKVVLWTIVLWGLNLKVFLFLSNFSQVSTIWKYSSGIFDFYIQLVQYYLEFVTTIPVNAFALVVAFSIILFVFWYYYFLVYFHKLPGKKVGSTTGLDILASIVTFLGFGCVACGQTLLTSIIFLFVSSTSMYVAEFIGSLSMVLGIAILSYATYKNYKMYHNSNICKI